MGGAIFQGTFTLGGNAMPNITGMSFDDAGADVISRVVGDTFDTHYMGTRNATMTINTELAEASAATVGTQFENGTIGAAVLNMFGTGTGKLTITSAVATMLTQNIAGAVNGICAATFTVALNDVTKGSL